MVLCHDPEGWHSVSRLRPFDLTRCFEEGLLISPLLFLFVLCSSFRVRRLLKVNKEERSLKSIRFLRAKLFLLICATCITTVDLIVFIISRGRGIVAVTPIALVLQPLSFLTATLLTMFNHERSHTPSSILLGFWPLYELVLLIWMRTLAVVENYPLGPLCRKGIVGIIGLLSLYLECVSPEIGSEGLPNGKSLGKHPAELANLYSIWGFSWMTPLMKKGASQFITEEDLPPLSSEDESAKLTEKLDNSLKKCKLVWVALILAYGDQYAIAAVLKIAQDLFAFSQPQLLRMLLSYISTYQPSINARFPLTENSGSSSIIQGFTIATAMLVAAVTQTVLLHQYFQRCFETGMRVRAGLVNRIYKKSLLLSSIERVRSSGDITNLMSVDATRLQDFCTYGLIAISGPFQITLAFVSLYDILGWPAFVGVAIMLLSVPLNAAVARTLKNMQEKQMKTRDKRTQMMTELLNNIKTIKFYAWENIFLQRILDIRNNEELMILKKISVVTSLNMALWTGIPLLVAFCSFAVAGLVSAKTLTSDIIFPSISLFMLLQFPLAMFSQVTSNIIEAVVSLKRLQSFLDADELQLDARVLLPIEDAKPGSILLEIKGGDFRWSNESAVLTLEDINLVVRKGELVGLMGQVGAGKSSLLSAIIGEMKQESGQVAIRGSIAYAPQIPWIMNASIKDNIIFSHEFDEAFYNAVIDACALGPDLSVLPFGDRTEVGEKGITLSGGQKARVSLARAVYARADIILLDDVLAAVDPHVARQVFDKVIGPDGLLSRKARIHVTNSTTFLHKHDWLVHIRRGIILELGSYITLASDRNSRTARLIRDHGVSTSSSGSVTPGYDQEIMGRGAACAEARNPIYCDSFEDDPPKAVVVEPVLKKLQKSNEHSEQGIVQKFVYAEYIKAASKLGFVTVLLASILQQATAVTGNIILRAWGEHNQLSGGNTHMGKYLLAYGLSSLGSTLLGAISAIVLWLLVSIRTARSLHESMLRSVLWAPLSFFELTPIGRIMNLFSRDVYVVDQILPRVISSLIRTVCVCIGIVAVIGSSFPLFLLVIIPLAWFYRRIMIYYLSTSRELKRLDATTRSPIFSWFSETLGGLSTIRAFSQQGSFIRQIEMLVDRNQICYLPSISVNRWLAVRLELIGALIIFIASILSLTTLITSGIDAGLVGLVLSYGLNATSSLNWVVRSASDVEQNIISVERILHYIKLKPEASQELPCDNSSSQWPTTGKVDFCDYSMRYREGLDLSLKNISLNIAAGEKIGVCGRTGAGKSSLLLALFRIIEPSSGIIYIDDIDITNIGLRKLRASISIVPQSPDLFEGTIRENIDPAGEYEDCDIWEALEQVHLKNYIEGLGRGLDTPVQEGGSSLSQGQRQLVCFARALLKKTKILVLDEATSSVDLDTDNAIQEIIRGPQFKSVTMFVIAHRLNTIIDSDRVLVLDRGSVKEFDVPRVLLNKQDSEFLALASEAGLAFA